MYYYIKIQVLLAVCLMGSVQDSLALTYTAWQELHFTSTEIQDASISGPESDPDRDGAPNLIEYTCLGNPKSTDPAMLTSGLTGEGTFRFELPFSSIRPTQVTMEYSNDLKTWTAGLELTSIAITPSARLVYTDRTPQVTSQYRFRRLSFAAPLPGMDDTDFDGLDDQYEEAIFGHLNASAYEDSDGDGLLNLHELQGIRVKLEEGEEGEVHAVLNANAADSDGDGIEDLVEILGGTDPTETGNEAAAQRGPSGYASIPTSSSRKGKLNLRYRSPLSADRPQGSVWLSVASTNGSKYKFYRTTWALSKVTGCADDSDLWDSTALLPFRIRDQELVHLKLGTSADWGKIFGRMQVIVSGDVDFSISSFSSFSQFMRHIYDDPPCMPVPQARSNTWTLTQVWLPYDGVILRAVFPVIVPSLPRAGVVDLACDSLVRTRSHFGNWAMAGSRAIVPFAYWSDSPLWQTTNYLPSAEPASLAIEYEAGGPLYLSNKVGDPLPGTRLYLGSFDTMRSWQTSWHGFPAGQFDPSMPVNFNLVFLDPGEARLTVTNTTRADQISKTYIIPVVSKPTLHVDSNNDGQINSTDETDKVVPPALASHLHSGLVIQADDYDADNDGVPDWVDGIGAFPALDGAGISAGPGFYPLKVKFDPKLFFTNPANVGSTSQESELWVRFRYSASDPQGVQPILARTGYKETDLLGTQQPPTSVPTGGRMRIWKKNANEARLSSPLANGSSGDFIPAETWIPAHTLLSGQPEGTLYVEGIRATPAEVGWGQDRICMDVSYDPFSDPEHISFVTDEVSATVIRAELNVWCWKPYAYFPAEGTEPEKRHRYRVNLNSPFLALAGPIVQEGLEVSGGFYTAVLTCGDELDRKDWFNTNYFHGDGAAFGHVFYSAVYEGPGMEITRRTGGGTSNVTIVREEVWSGQTDNGWIGMVEDATSGGITAFEQGEIFWHKQPGSKNEPGDLKNVVQGLWMAATPPLLSNGERYLATHTWRLPPEKMRRIVEYDAWRDYTAYGLDIEATENPGTRSPDNFPLSGGGCGSFAGMALDYAGMSQPSWFFNSDHIHPIGSRK
jgi:hypothetical protein